MKKLLIKLRHKLNYVRFLYLTKVWGMDIHETARFSLSTKFDFTHPKGIHIGEKTYVAFRTSILTHDMTRGMFVDTYIGKNCFVGAHSLIMPGVKIGDNSIVAAGSIVTKDVPPYTIVAGNPARVIREGIEVKGFGRFMDADENEKAFKRGMQNKL